MFPMPPGQGFPWAHSSRGKPRRGMMRRAVFSGKFHAICIRIYIHLFTIVRSCDRDFRVRN